VKEGHCRGENCGRRIKWVRTERGKLVPVDPKEVTIVTALGRYVKGWIPHHATCPDAGEFRRGNQT
jgi:hypothetical protein